MIHFLRIAFLLLFLTFGWAEEGTSSLSGGVAESMAHYLDESSQARRTDGLTDLSKHEKPSSAAILTDASNLYRICNTRPERIVQSIGTKIRLAGKFLFYSFIKQPLHASHHREESPLTAYSLRAASCSYYVIALRHILR